MSASRRGGRKEESHEHSWSWTNTLPLGLQLTVLARPAVSTARQQPLLLQQSPVGIFSFLHRAPHNCWSVVSLSLASWREFSVPL